jgi:hypothetical protein
LFRLKAGNSFAILGNSFEINSLSGLSIGNSNEIVGNILENYCIFYYDPK